MLEKRRSIKIMQFFTERIGRIGSAKQVVKVKIRPLQPELIYFRVPIYRLALHSIGERV
jgi:hypothetical protein